MDRLDEIRARLEAATDGPWEAKPLGIRLSDHGMYIPDVNVEVHPHAEVVAKVGVLLPPIEPEQIVGNAEFIAHSYTDVEFLLEHIAYLERKVEVLEQDETTAEDVLNGE